MGPKVKTTRNSERIKQSVSKAIVWEFRADSMRKLLNVSCGVGAEVGLEIGVGVGVGAGTKIGTQYFVVVCSIRKFSHN